MHHTIPTLAGTSLNRLAISATLHCLTGCAIGEVSGMVIGTALGWSDVATIVLAVALAFLFGYSLTAMPLIRARLEARVIISSALASDTVSIAIMELIDNAFILLIPGAMEAGIDSLLFWSSLLGGLAIAFPFALAANRYMISRGLGHAKVMQHPGHGRH